MGPILLGQCNSGEHPRPKITTTRLAELEFYFLAEYPPAELIFSQNNISPKIRHAAEPKRIRFLCLERSRPPGPYPCSEMEVQACFRSSPIHLWVTGELNLHSQIRTQRSPRKRRRDTSRKAATAPVTRASARVQVNLHFQFTVKIEASTSSQLLSSVFSQIGKEILSLALRRNFFLVLYYGYRRGQRQSA